jgi:hypothetical protein
MLRRVVKSLHSAIRAEIQLPPQAKAQRRMDRRTGLGEDPGIETAIELAVEWLCRAQDCSLTRDGGVARDFSLLTGWSASYPEATGHAVQTLLAVATLRDDQTLRARARTMLDWLVSIQFPDGGFQASTIGATPKVPTVFNTGQVLLGLASGTREWDARYRPHMRRAADWLVALQDPDGSWRKFQSPFTTTKGAKTYDTHIGWGLLEAARLEPEARYEAVALANIRWAMGEQRANGWFDRCCLNRRLAPLTHTLGYALRGILEGYAFTRDTTFLMSARRAADGMLGALGEDGFLPGRLDAEWHGRVRWSCLTGSAQIAHCWLLLYQFTGEQKYRDAAFSVNRYVRRTIRVDGNLDQRGAIKGSFPVSGGYGRFEYLAWAAKFFIDANLLELAVRAQ